MKQARRWVTMTAALVLLPALAMAQGKKKPKPKPTPAATAPAPAPAAGGEIELDANPAPAATTPDTAAPAGTAGTAAAPQTGGICDIDPTACPKDVAAVKQQSAKDVNAEIYAVQQVYVYRRHRLEIEPYWGFTLNDQFVSHPAPGASINYYITNVLAVGLNGNVYAGLNQDSDFNFENRRATRLAVPLTEYSWGANANFTYVPVYGKLAGLGDFIFSYDAYVTGGVGLINTRPIAVIDPDNRDFNYKSKLDFDVGIGLRIFLNRWFAVNLEVRDYIYNEQLEALTISPTEPTNSSTWYDNGTHITNNVQAQLGVSIFLPFSWDYRLPK
jgi:outer membrane beta-barrel protein